MKQRQIQIYELILWALYELVYVAYVNNAEEGK